MLLTPGLLAVSLIALVGIAYAGSSDRIAAGMEVAGIDVGGLTVPQAEKKLERASTKLVWQPVVFVAGERSFEVAPAQLGVRADWDAAATHALRDGDGFGPLRGLTRLRVRFLGVDVDPPLTHSSLALDRFLDQIGKAVNRPVKEPGLVLRSSEPSIVPGHGGRKLDRKAATRMILSALGSFSRQRVVLPVRDVKPSASRADMMRVIDQAQTAVSAPVRVLLGAGGQITVTPDQIEKMLVYPHNGERSLRISSDQHNAVLNKIAKQLNRPAREASFSVSGSSVTLVSSRPGRVLDREGTAAAILTAALETVGRSEPVAMEIEQPERTTEEARAMGITGLVGSYETSFTGTSNRIHNVQLVAKLIDDKFIAPGETFSFNETTGERNSQKGFLSAPVIINGELEEGLGGGVCQVSTTTFNAAYEAGLPILERTNHALYISHYPLGRDATVNWPSTDLKFKNDTGHWLLLRAFTSSDTMVVALYGTPQHRRVVSDAQPLQITGPPPLKKIPDPTLAKGQTVVEEYGQSSSATSVRRRVYDKDGKLLFDSVFSSRYRSSPKVVRVGTKKSKKDKAKTTTTTTSEEELLETIPAETGDGSDSGAGAGTSPAPGQPVP